MMRRAKAPLRGQQPSQAPPPPRRYAAELIGTFALTLVAAGADVVDAASSGGLGHVARYLAPGLILVALIYTLSGVSGAHFNPAVTVGFALRGVFPPRLIPGYLLAQFIGATLAGLALVAVLGEFATHGASRPTLDVEPLTALATEIVLTVLLVFIIIGTSDQKAVVGKNSAIAVGFTIAACGLFASPLSGASMNPARSLGPALATLHFTGWWIYVVGPLAGASIAVGMLFAVYGPPDEEEDEAAQGAAA